MRHNPDPYSPPTADSRSLTRALLLLLPLLDSWKALRLMAKKDVSLLSKVSAPGGSLEAAVKYMDDKLKGELKEEKEESALAPPDAADVPDAPADPVEA